MAYDVSKLAKLAALKALAEKVKSDYATKADLKKASDSAAAAFKSGKVDGNTVSLYTSEDKSGTAAFTFDFPTEMFLDQAKTEFIAKFKWAEATYPGSTNPSLDGKPVMVLAVKGENPDSVAYSFLNMAALVDTYKAKETGKDASTTIEISGYEVEVKVNISKEDGNVLELKGDGLYVPTPEKTDISGKADKVKSATSGNFAGLDENGNLTDSGKKADDFVAAEAGKRLMTDAEGTKLGKIAEEATKTEKSDTNGCVKINGVDTEVYKEPTDVIHGSIATDDEVTEMLNEVFTTTSV